VRAACLALLALLAALPAQAQRSRCGLGLGLEGLAAADRMLAEATAAPSFATGREAAATLADQAGSEASTARLHRSLEPARFSLTLARHRLDRAGCS
jgi:hypothetical protein